MNKENRKKSEESGNIENNEKIVSHILGEKLAPPFSDEVGEGTRGNEDIDYNQPI